MKTQNIFTLIALISTFIFTSCSKEDAVLPLQKDNNNQIQTMNPIGDDEDDEYIVIRPKPKSAQTSSLLVGATVDLSDGSFTYSGVVDAAGQLEFLVPANQLYTYIVTYNNEELLNKVVDVQEVDVDVEDFL